MFGSMPFKRLDRLRFVEDCAFQVAAKPAVKTMKELFKFDFRQCAFQKALVNGGSNRSTIKLEFFKKLDVRQYAFQKA